MSQPPELHQFRYLERLRVRWAEVDMQKIVFNGHYLMYFDTAVAGYWRALAMPYHETMESLQGDLYVRKAVLEYLGSARYDERLEVGMRCERIGNSSLLFRGAVFRGPACLVHGELVYVFADPATQTSRPVPQPLRDVLQAYEAGAPMAQVQTGDWQTLGPASRPLREEVFVREQGISASLIVDDADAQALHAVARNRFGLAVGTARLVFQPEGQARLGRMAVLASVRGAGVGQALLQTLSQAAQLRGVRRLTLHAQRGAQGFYERLGFTPQGEPFLEAGLEHQVMSRILA